MRRLFLVTLAALLLLAPAAAAHGSKPAPTVVAGAAHKAGARVKGWFAIEATAGRSTHPAVVVVMLGNGHGGVAAGGRSVPSLRPGERRRAHFSFRLPKLEAGNWRINICAGGHCLHFASFQVDGTSLQSTVATSPPAPAPTTNGTGALPQTSCTPVGGPLAYTVEEPFHHVGQCGDEYFGFVPASYSPSTPMPLLIWMHGCGGEAEGDAWTVGSYSDEAGHGWLTLSLGGRDGACWSPSGDEGRVMAALADFESHFDVDTHRVILGGYSSGGDLAYRTGFRHSSTFAGLLIENSAPFRDTESTQAESLGAATTKFHIVHLAHEEDETYGLAQVESEVAAVEAAGFPITLIKRPGKHYDSHTDSDLREYLLPHIEDGWTSP